MSNKFHRLSGKMYLLLAESSSETRTIRHGYSSAARAFLTAGNMSLAQAAHRSAYDAARTTSTSPSAVRSADATA
jgi:hypothetical protein